MTVWLVESGGTTTLYASREVAEQSIKQTWERLVGGGFINSMQYTIDEVVVHERPFDVRRS